MHYCKQINLEDVKEKLSGEVSDKTMRDIEDFLKPKFDSQYLSNNTHRKWRIVQDGHGRWREINVDGNSDGIHCDISCKPSPRTMTSSKLLFSNNILNTGPPGSNIQSGRSSQQDSNYKTLSTTTRANIFPGVGKHNWFSQSNNVYTESALKLGDTRGCDLQDRFFGITRDALGAWNEASVHHERMKKAWDIYLESLVKTERVVRQKVNCDRNMNLKKQEAVSKTKKIFKKMKNSVQEIQNLPETIKNNEHESNNQLVPSQKRVLDRDDDFWDFYEQPFVK